MLHFRFHPSLFLESNPARQLLLVIIFFTIPFRKKHRLVRNDFLDCMIELREGGKDEAQGDMQSAKNASIGATFSKLQ
jgi:tRNA G46 methylase TrmB